MIDKNITINFNIAKWYFPTIKDGIHSTTRTELLHQSVSARLCACGYSDRARAIRQKRICKQLIRKYLPSVLLGNNYSGKPDSLYRKTIPFKRCALFVFIINYNLKPTGIMLYIECITYHTHTKRFI